MNGLILAFITGLTTGGLSCLAVQGGLLTTALAPKGAAAEPEPRKAGVLPILLFLAAKLVAYSLLGLLLGALGSMLQLTPVMRAVLLIAIGIFMVGNGLRMLNVHPIFRYFVFEPPAFITRYLRRRAKQDADAVTPLFLGALTVLIPCGVTQAMMALAMGTGDALEAAGLMASFTLGSSIIFFAVVYLATRLGTLLEKNFTRTVAVVLLILGLVSVNSGLNLVGIPLLPRFNQIASVPTALPAAEASSGAAVDGEGEVLTITVKNNGYAPASLSARAGVPVRLTFVSKNVSSCARALVIPELRVEEVLPATGEFSVDLPAQPAGKVLRYSCSMGMYTGQIIFDQ